MRYLYYKLWQNFKRVKTNDMPATNAMIFISMCEFANLFVLQTLAEFLLNIKVDFSSKTNIYYYTITIGLIVYLVNYFYLYKNKDKLYEKYKNESKKQKIIGNILLIIYIFGSFALVFYLGPKYTANIVN